MVVEFDIFLEQFRNFVGTLDGESPNSWSERTTINRVIKPVLASLGYESSSNNSVEPWLEDEPFTVQEADGLKTYKPDFIVVNDHKYLKYIQDEKGYKKLEEARSSVILSIEAKYWGRIDEYYSQHVKEDTKRADKKSNSESSKAMDFDEQCLKYMEILNRPYGMLTDGKIWRLYSLSFSSPSHRPYFQFNLGHMIKHIQNSDFLVSDSDREVFEQGIKYFYFIFRKKSLYNDQGEELFADELLNYSKKYVARVEEDLKDRFVNAMTIACNGFQRAIGHQRYDIDLIRSVSESHIFNILFLKYCETKNILPIKQDPEGYRRISISDLLDRLENFDPNKEEDNLNELLLRRMFRDINYSANGVELYDRLLKLTKIVQDGTSKEFKNFTIKGFKESIFSDKEWKFVNEFKLTNKEMINILFEIGYSESGVRGRKYQQIPYNSFSPRQLGSIYESFLEFKLEKATEDMAFIKKQWFSANLKSEKIKNLDVPKVRKGELFFTPNNKERKFTGSYYTPDCVVQFIVQETLESLTKEKSSKEILKMRVCDPAMGSAHFLIAALDFLARKYNDALVKETNDDVSLPSAVVKKEILHNCIYGADINQRAVKLAKMSLWLESAITSEPLENLEDQIKCANSLIDEELWKNEWKFLNSGIDAVVGNPPYLGEKGHKEIFQEIAHEWLGKSFYQGKMDLFYFFFHLGLDILRDGGRLGFITTNYFTTALGAKKLRTDFFERSNLDLLMNLNELKVFGEASGQHNMITVLTKTDESGSTRVFNSNESGACSRTLISEIRDGKNKNTVYSEIDKTDLFEGEEKYIRVANSSVKSSKTTPIHSTLSKIKKSDFLLGNVVDVSTGIQTGADKVSDRHIEKYKIRAQKGDGIFVLSKQEINDLKIPEKEAKSLVKPFYKNSDINKFGTAYKTDEYILYLDKRLFDIKKLSQGVQKHIKKYADVIHGSSSSAPYLHRPRENGIFSSPKIVAPQRSKLNTFGYSEGEWYAATDVFFITTTEETTFDLKFLLGIINSKLMYAWLYFYGKRKGDALELIAKPISEIPIKDVNIKQQDKVLAQVKILIKEHNEVAWKKLNEAVYEIYGLSKDEIKAVEALYEQTQIKKNEDVPKKKSSKAA